MLISVIVTTYNWPAALRAVLSALSEQTDREFEVIIADDGSGEATHQVITDFQSNPSFSLTHCWQADQGFRASASRNQACLAARGDYFIFLDGDCIPPPNFVAKHRRLAELGYWVKGNRILLSQHFTQQVLEQRLPIHRWQWPAWWRARLKRQCNRVLPLLRLPASWRWLRLRRPSEWRGAKGCNLAIWRDDLWRVNGWDAHYQGWGYEDSDLVIRLLNAGIQHKDGRYYLPVFHLWHTENNRTTTDQNWDLLLKTRNEKRLLAEEGLAQREQEHE